MTDKRNQLIAEWLSFVQNYRNRMEPNYAGDDITLWAYDNQMTDTEAQCYLDVCEKLYQRSIGERPLLKHNEDVIKALRAKLKG